jgi:hypothetical protein
MTKPKVKTMEKITNSLLSRVTRSPADGQDYARFTRKIHKGIQIYSPRVLEVVEKVRLLKVGDQEKHEIVRQTLSSLLPSEILSKEYIAHLKHNTVGGFELALLMTTNAAVALHKDAVKLLALASIQLRRALAQSPTLKEFKFARGATQLLIFNLEQIAKAGHGGQELNLYIEIAVSYLDAIDVYENIVNQRIVYLDDHLAITWYKAPHNSSRKFQSVGETVIAVNANGLWSFDKHKGTNVPVSSLRKARETCLNWRGHQLKGNLTHDEAERIAKFLGFNVTGKIAVLKPRR